MNLLMCYGISALLLLLGSRSVDGRHYVLIRRVYSGQEGHAMMEKDESSRLFGWPLGVSSELALMDSAPIFRAVVEAKDDENNEVIQPAIHRSPGLERGRGAPRRIEDSEKQIASPTIQEGKNVSSNSTEKSDVIDIHNLEPETAESLGLNNSTIQAPPTNESVPAKPLTESSESTSDVDDEETLDLSEIEKIMEKHKIRVMGTPHPMVKKYLDEQNSQESLLLHVPTSSTESRNDSQEASSPTTQTVPDQVMKIAEWLLNRNL